MEDGEVARRYAIGPTSWRASPRLYTLSVPIPDILFTDPVKFAVDGTPERLDALARHWPERGPPFALLSWLAHDIAAHAINPRHLEAGRVQVHSRVPRPVVGGSRIAGPFLFLGIVARGAEGGAWECRAASGQPILSPTIPMPVDSDYERRALDALRDAALSATLGGPARVELEKPLFPFVVRGGLCLLGALFTVTRPGGRGHLPAGPGPLLEGSFAVRDTPRDVIEVMGFADAAYERKKENAHAPIRRIGRVLRTEGRQFDSLWNDFETQTLRIARRIEKDIVGRWKPA